MRFIETPAPGNGKANAARATGPANAASGYIGLSQRILSQDRNKVLDSSVSHRLGWSGVRAVPQGVLSEASFDCVLRGPVIGPRRVFDLFSRGRP